MEIWKSTGKFNSNRRSLISAFAMLSPLSLEVAAQKLVGLWNTFSIRDSLVAGTWLSPRSWSSFRMESPRAVLQCLPCRWRREGPQFLQWESSFQGRKPSTYLERSSPDAKCGVVLLSVLWGWCRAWLYQRLNPLLCRWEELHAVASEPTEQHVLFAGDASDAANGLYSALSSSICSVTTPGNPSPVPPYTSALNFVCVTEWGKMRWCQKWCL